MYTVLSSRFEKNDNLLLTTGLDSTNHTPKRTWFKTAEILQRQEQEKLLQQKLKRELEEEVKLEGQNKAVMNSDGDSSKPVIGSTDEYDFDIVMDTENQSR